MCLDLLQKLRYVPPNKKKRRTRGQRRDMLKTRNANGYRLIYLPDHKAAYTRGNWKGYVYEHIVKAEAMLMRSLTSEEEVHHLDFCRLNNEKENLLVLEKSQHVKLHNWLSSTDFTKESTPLLRYCDGCGIHLDRQQKRFCSRVCVESTKVDKVSKEDLKILLTSHNLSEIGRMFGVSANAVKKWIKKWGL